jgi:indolepyruvate ferredoxin oxidoreductase alpha subunit
LVENHQRILMGNEALGRGIVEAGVTLATSYPGTPASEGFPPFSKGGIKGGLSGAPL